MQYLGVIIWSALLTITLGNSVDQANTFQWMNYRIMEPGRPKTNHETQEHHGLMSMLEAKAKEGEEALMEYISRRFPVMKQQQQSLSTADANPPVQAQISDQCIDDYTIYVQNLLALSDWAWIMADSWGVPEAGGFSGNDVWEGRYGQCEKVNANMTGADGKPFVGHPCTTMYPKRSWIDPAAYVMCLPSSCNASDVYGVVKLYLNDDMLPAPYPVLPSRTYSWCEDYDKTTSFTPAVIGASVVLGFFGFWVLIGTLYDAITLGKRTKPRRKPNDGNTNNNAAQRDNVPDTLPSAPIIEAMTDFCSDEPITIIHTAQANGQAVNGGFISSEVKLTAEELLSESTIHVQANGYGNRIEPDNVADKESISTKVDKPDVYKPNTFGEILLSFSVYKNARAMTSVDHGRGSIKCVHAVRFLAMCWIIVGHTWQLGIYITDSPTVENDVDIELFMERVTHSAINYMNLSVETFFVLSAMLTTMSLMRQFKKNNNRASGTMFGLYYFHRYWRLTPVYMLILMMFTVFFPYLRTGPLFPPYFPSSEHCKENWWKHLIYLNNLIDVNPDTECMGWSWYMANDFQFYVIAPVFICLLFWVPIAGIVMTVLAILGSLASMAYLQHGIYVREDTDWYYDIYMKPWTRSATYFIGIFLGYIMFKTNGKIRMHKALAVFGWIIALTFITHAIYTPAALSDASDAGWIAFDTTQRPMFALGVSWIIFACYSGYGGFVNSILSWRFWIPLGRLTYTGYLIHPIVLYYTYYSIPVQIYINDWVMIYYFLGTLMLSLGVSFLVSLTLEVPFLALEKVMFKNVKK